MKKPTIEAGVNPMLALKVYMIAAGLSAKDLAEKIGMTQATMSRKLSGRNEFKLSEIRAITEALCLTSEETAHIFLK